MLDKDFYLRSDVVQISRDLLGKVLCINIQGHLRKGMIVETEAYCGATDKACHAYQRRTPRTETMYQAGGIAYVYLCYGMHYLFNVVTNVADKADAVLIRAIEPLEGTEAMSAGFTTLKPPRYFTAGPGRVAKVLGIDKEHNGLSLLQETTLWIEDQGFVIEEAKIGVSTRIGVQYAQESALLPWRFYVQDNPWCSKAK